jgi:hypothetical protein
MIQLSDTSIIMDASEYIKELKQKVARINQEIVREEETQSHKNSFPKVHTAGRHPYLSMHYVLERSLSSSKALQPYVICMIDGSVLYLHLVA